MAAQLPPTRDSWPDLYAHAVRDDGRTTAVVKVRLPIEHHLKLHTLRLMRGEGISDTVTAALAFYFERMRAESEPEDPIPAPTPAP